MLRAKPDLMPETAPSLRKRITVCRHEMRPLAAGCYRREAIYLSANKVFEGLGTLSCGSRADPPSCGASYVGHH